MILTKLELSVFDLMELNINDAYGIHKTVYSMFPQDEEHERDFLYAKNYDRRKNLNILVLSKRNPTVPDFCKISCKKIPTNFLSFEQYNFRIMANPVRRSVDSSKLVPILENDDLVEWFYLKAKKAGMLVDTSKLDIQDKGVEKVYKGERELTFNKARFIGSFKVVDREAFINTFENGFGRGKGFGYGLLEITPVMMF